MSLSAPGIPYGITETKNANPSVQENPPTLVELPKEVQQPIEKPVENPRRIVGTVESSTNIHVSTQNFSEHVIGLGLDEDLGAHRSIGAITYKRAGWQNAGLTSVDWGRASIDDYYFKQSFIEAAVNATDIVFNVTNFDPSYQKPGITSYEFNYIINHPELLKKTIFVRNNMVVIWNGYGFIQ